MFIVCLDLEGVLIPEVWINVAVNKKVDELKLTTRDEPDYDKLMKRRLKLLKKNDISIKDIQTVIEKMEPLPGAIEFIKWLQNVSQVIILTDSYIEFVKPLFKKLGNPTVFCHNLEIDTEGYIIDYHIRIKEMKKVSVEKFKELNYNVIAVGDSYNDVQMLKEADHGILFRPPEKVIKEFPQFPVIREYDDLKKLISDQLGLD